MPNINLSILNQKATPAFFADTFANRPAASFVGRIFISTDTFDLYRDTGTAWVLLSPSSSGTISGSGTTNSIPLFTGATSIGDSVITQQTGAQSVTIGSFATPFNVIGYANYYGSQFIINGGLATQILAANGSTITAGTNITISGGQISATSSGGVTGTGSTGQVALWSGASSINGSSGLFFDTAQSHLGIGTITPGTALDIHDDQSTLLQLNSTLFTNDCRIAFQSNGITNWRIGNFYNTGANDFAFYDVLNSQERLSIKTTGQTFVGTQTTSSGLLVVNNSTSDQHLVVLGASAPSMRVRTSGTAPTYQFGLGLATTINNFIQGTTGGEMCIFNDSSVASPILFGIANVGITNEVGRFASNGNFGLGTTTPGYSATNRKVLAINGGSNAGEGAIMAFMQNGINKGYVFSIQNDMELWCESGAMRIGNASLFDINFLTNNQIRMSVKSSGVINISNIPISSAGLVTGDIYSNAGILTIV